MEIAYNFNADAFDKTLFQSTISNNELMEQIYFGAKYPPDSGQYRQSNIHTGVTFVKSSSSTNVSIPIIYCVKENDRIVSLSTKIYYDNDYSCLYGSGDFKRYLWNSSRLETDYSFSVGGVPFYNIPNNNYLLDNWEGEYGYPFEFATNLPIFEVTSDFNPNHASVEDFAKTHNVGTMLAYSEVLRVLNEDSTPEEPDGDVFNISNVGIEGTWTQYGVNNTLPYYYRMVRGKIINGKIAFYDIPGVDNGVLKYGIKINGDLYGCQYSEDNGVTWHDTDTFPYTYFYRPRDKELGTFKYGLAFQSFLPHWKNEDDAEDYITGDKPITDADNWDDIWRKYPDKWKPTGESDDATIFGDVYTRAHFSQQYICSNATIVDISNGLFDVSTGGIFERIKQGVEMYGANPIDCVQSLVYYPMDLTSVFTNTISQNYIYFGGYKFDLTNGTANKIVFPNGYKDLGTFDIQLPYGDSYKSYEPYAKLRVYLPYIGWRELDIKRYANKSVKVRYYIDTRTNGMCTACLIANNLLVDYFNGQMGVSMPITLTDFTSFANSQINTILGGGGDMINNGGDIIGGLMGASPIGVGVGMAKGFGNLTKMEYGLQSNNINNYNSTRGTSSSMINQYLPQEVLFEFELQEVDATKNSPGLRGYPSNASGNINQFTGYLEVQEVDLKCYRATDTEKSEIESLLRQGIRI